MVLGALLLANAWVLIRQPGSSVRSPVDVTVTNVTQSETGARHATFLLSNTTSHTVWIPPSWVLENSGGPWRTNLMPANAIHRDVRWAQLPLPFQPRSWILEPGECYTFTQPLPFDDSRWRASFWYEVRRSPGLQLLDRLTVASGIRKELPVRPIQSVSTSWIE